MYITALELSQAVDPTELAKIATPLGQRAISGAAMAAIIAGTLVNTDPAYPAAVAALATINTKILERGNYVDGFLGLYAPLPIPDQYVPTIVKQIMVALVRYDLAYMAPTDTVTQRYKDARFDLQQIQKGLILLALPLASTTVLSGGTPGTVSVCPPKYALRNDRLFQNAYGLDR